MIVELDACAEGAVAQESDFPAARGGDFSDEAADAETLEAASDRGAVAAALVGIGVVLWENAAEVSVAKAPQLVFPAQHGAEELDVFSTGRIETGEAPRPTCLGWTKAATC